METLKLDIAKAGVALTADIEAKAQAANALLHSGKGAGNDFLGWISLPSSISEADIAAIEKEAAKLRAKADVVICIGIGGSYLGAKAVLEAMVDPFKLLHKEQKFPTVLFAGQNISEDYTAELLDAVKEHSIAAIVISKSGTTTEPAIAFRIFKELCEKKYGREGAKERIFATTDKERGALKQLADDEGYETFVVPDDIGGRFSVLTPVGLLPMAAAGVNIDEVMKGAAQARIENRYTTDHLAAKYAALRSILHRKGKSMEILVNYDPALVMFGEWYKQLFNESEGKDHKGIFATSANFSTDLHSIGQFIQDGTRMMFETVLWVREPRSESIIKEEKDDIDGLNYLAGKSVQFVNSKAYQGTLLAHVDGGTPNIVFEIDRADAWHFGYLVYFFEKACGISGYLLGVNPFDQPGVEAYKKNMFALLGKKGYEQRKKYLEGRM